MESIVCSEDDFDKAAIVAVEIHVAALEKECQSLKDENAALRAERESRAPQDSAEVQRLQREKREAEQSSEAWRQKFADQVNDESKAIVDLGEILRQIEDKRQEKKKLECELLRAGAGLRTIRDEKTEIVDEMVQELQGELAQQSQRLADAEEIVRELKAQLEETRKAEQQRRLDLLDRQTEQLSWERSQAEQLLKETEDRHTALLNERDLQITQLQHDLSENQPLQRNISDREAVANPTTSGTSAGNTFPEHVTAERAPEAEVDVRNLTVVGDPVESKQDEPGGPAENTSEKKLEEIDFFSVTDLQRQLIDNALKLEEQERSTVKEQRGKEYWKSKFERTFKSVRTVREELLRLRKVNEGLTSQNTCLIKKLKSLEGQKVEAERRGAETERKAQAMYKFRADIVHQLSNLVYELKKAKGANPSAADVLPAVEGMENWTLRGIQDVVAQNVSMRERIRCLVDVDAKKQQAEFEEKLKNMASQLEEKNESLSIYESYVKTTEPQPRDERTLAFYQRRLKSIEDERDLAREETVQAKKELAKTEHELRESHREKEAAVKEAKEEVAKAKNELQELPRLKEAEKNARMQAVEFQSKLQREKTQVDLMNEARLDLQAELCKLQHMRDEKEAAVKKYEDAFSQHQQEISKKNADWQEERAALQRDTYAIAANKKKVEKRLSDLEAEISKFEDTSHEEKVRLDSLNKFLQTAEQVTKRIADMRVELAERGRLFKQAEEANKRAEEWQEKCDKLQTQFAEAKRAHEDLLKNPSDRRRGVDLVTDVQISADADRQSTNETLILKQQVEALSQEVKIGNDHVFEAKRGCEQHARESEEWRHKFEALQKTLLDLESEKSELEAKAAAATEESERQKKELERVSAQQEESRIAAANQSVVVDARRNEADSQVEVSIGLAAGTEILQPKESYMEMWWFNRWFQEAQDRKKTNEDLKEAKGNLMEAERRRREMEARASEALSIACSVVNEATTGKRKEAPPEGGMPTASQRSAAKAPRIATASTMCQARSV